MIETTPPLPPELGATVPAPEHAPLLEQLAMLRRENAALRAQNGVLQERIRELEARLSQNSSNSSRPPTSDPPQAPRKRPVIPSGRKRGGQPGHPGSFRALLPVEQVDEIVPVVPEHCRHCQQPFPGTKAPCRGRVWRH
jgi:transposase